MPTFLPYTREDTSRVIDTTRAIGVAYREVTTQRLTGSAKLVKAIVPLANMFGYTGDIRSMSQGRAASTMELAHYEEVPPNVAQEIIEKRSK